VRNVGLERALLALGLVVAVWLRSERFFVDPVSLWLDEAEWAERLLSAPLVDQGVRPLGLLWLVRALARSFGPSEIILRLPSYLAGVALVPLCYVTARQLFRSPVVRGLLPLAVALHPLLVDFSKEFKPYSVSVFCHALLLTLALAALKGDGRSRLWGCLLGAIVLLPFAYDVLFAYPAVFGTLFWKYQKARQKKEALMVALAAGVALAGILLLYVRVWRHIDGTSYGAAYWGGKYGVFLTDNRNSDTGPQPAAAVVWLWQKFAELFAGPAFAKPDWRIVAPYPLTRELQAAHGLVYGPLFLLGAFSAWRRSESWVVLLCGPLLVLAAFNVLGRWPFGLFRVNLFTLVYTLPTPLLALDDWVTSGTPKMVTRPMAVAAFVLVPRLSFSPPLPSIKVSRPWMAHSELRHVLRRLEAEPTEGRPLLLADYYTFQCLPFYEALYPRAHRSKLEARFRARRTMTVADVARALKATRDATVWVVVSRQGFVAPTRQLLYEQCQAVDEFDFGAHHLVARCHHGRTHNSSP
jgi:hypothetical protein